MSFQTHKTFVHLRKTNEDIFKEIQAQCKLNISRTRKVVEFVLFHTKEKNGGFFLRKKLFLWLFFLKLRLNHWSHMDYFNNVVITFLELGTFQLHYCLCRVRKLSDFIKNILICVDERRGFAMTQGWVINDNFHFWVNYPFKPKIYFAILRVCEQCMSCKFHISISCNTDWWPVVLHLKKKLTEKQDSRVDKDLCRGSGDTYNLN